MKCVSGWSAWINQDMLDQATLKSSKSNYFKEDDVEPLPTNMQMKNLIGPTKAVCSTSFFGAVECRTVVGHKTPKSTGQDVECSTERGLLCKGQCFDYEIRVYCECSDITNAASSLPPTRLPPTTPRSVIVPVTTAQPAKTVGVCDPNIPNIEHPYSCTKFLQCVMSPNGTFIYAEKTCGDSMMFNPKAMVCDWPANVQNIKPACGGKPEKLRECLEGFTWSECSVPCNRACHYYNQILRGSTKCPAGSGDCIPGCVPIDAPLKCDYPKLWRDQKSCVELQACTCMGPNGEILKPGQVIKVNDCKTCQCLNNEYICANVPCSKQPSTLSPPLIVSSTDRQPIETIPLPPPEDFERTINIPYYLTICDPSIPHVAHPKSCYKFLHCQPLANGSYQYAVKTCYPDMMFNPTNMICDWPASVKAIKPACGSNPGEIEIWETIEIEESRRVVVKKPKTTAKPASSGSSGWAIVQTTYEESEYPEYMIKCPSATAPLKAHPDSCYKYLECLPDRNGIFRYQEKTCGPDMMYSPSSKDCTWPDTVIAQNPICAPQPTTTELPSFNLVTEPLRPSTQPPVTLAKTTSRPFIPTDAPIILPSTLTPPNQCEQSQLITLMNLLPDSAISASSILGNTFKPEFARIESKPLGQTSSGSWSPKTNDLNQFLQMAFSQPVPIYGVIIRGSPMFDQYVTSFKVLYSYDGSVFHVFADKNGRPQIFSGSVDAKTPVNTLFHTPIEAKIVRIYPISWKGSIALRAELLGCQNKMPPLISVTTKQPAPKTRKLVSSTVFVVPTTQVPVYTEHFIEPLCDDPLGVENQQMYTSQITLSSSKDSEAVKTKPRKSLEIIKLSSIRGWMPLTDNTNEFVQVSVF